MMVGPPLAASALGRRITGWRDQWPPWAFRGEAMRDPIAQQHQHMLGKFVVHLVLGVKPAWRFNAEGLRWIGHIPVDDPHVPRYEFEQAGVAKVAFDVLAVAELAVVAGAEPQYGEVVVASADFRFVHHVATAVACRMAQLARLRVGGGSGFCLEHGASPLSDEKKATRPQVHGR